MESKLSDARMALKEMISKLEEIVPKAKLDEPMTLHAITPHAQVFQTSFGREVNNISGSNVVKWNIDPRLIAMVCRPSCSSSLVHGTHIALLCLCTY